MEKHTCAGQIHDEFGVGFHPCSSQARLFEGGKWWCGIHAPSADERRRAKNQAKWDARVAQRDRANRIYDAERAVINEALAWGQDADRKDRLLRAVRALEKARG